ncbi:MarR family winged helix-turn-helix transcriptional regulator [Bailinhaonella thermotolerans]|uniref:MarR family transcriptional regulator n=1 Tax=Bailinhaonella thermotolerans TaxID=1070861 RepID=A0A3A4B8X4_9ACTN|nr:MarR family transcriptional regulator [Bailinhaonella thermotolerans]RJL34134.1 MarR family transcriptional regulator [Bailinhaonella thermotolerans]
MGETRWLDAVQQRAWRSYIDGSMRLAEMLERDLKARHGLSMAEYEILVRLAEAPGRRLRMASLAASVSQSRSRLSHTVRRLEAAGLVAREACGTDRRGVECVLTERGFGLLREAAPGHVETVRELFVDVVAPEDLEAIGRAFRAVGERIDALR